MWTLYRRDKYDHYIRGVQVEGLRVPHFKKEVRNFTNINKTERPFFVGRLLVSVRLSTVTSLHKTHYSALYCQSVVPVKQAANNQTAN